jgi:alkanesulfonate monooxygenase SsuD/methylene tetrahydromethanopterin reductase-like flavin-dependent oxidoreductase (luciferase family)
MQVGYFAQPLHPPGSDLSETLQHDLYQVEKLDEWGYHEAWIGEHYSAQWENISAPEIFIANALARTKNIILGTGVTCMPNHNPFHIAHRIAVLDNLARGRFYWGVGSGGTPSDFKVFGVDPAKGENRMLTRKNIDMVLKIWEGLPPGHYEQECFWEFNIPEPDVSSGFAVHTKPWSKPHPPIAMAGLTRKSDTLVFAGEKGFLPMSIHYVPENTLRTHWDAVEEGAAKTGLTPDRRQWRIAREVFVAPTTEEARELALAKDSVMRRDFEDHFRNILANYGFLDLIKPDPDIPDEDITSEWMVDNTWLVGSPQDVAAKIRSIYEKVGGFGVLLTMAHEWEPRAEWERSNRLLAEEVMPLLADLTGA